MITGASSGLGEALAHTFYNSGCKIILVSRRKEELERVKNDLMNTHQVCSVILILIGKYIGYQLFYTFLSDSSNLPTYCFIIGFN